METDCFDGRCVGIDWVLHKFCIFTVALPKGRTDEIYRDFIMEGLKHADLLLRNVIAIVTDHKGAIRRGQE